MRDETGTQIILHLDAATSKLALGRGPSHKDIARQYLTTRLRL